MLFGEGIADTSPLVSLLAVLRRALPQDTEASVLQILRNLASSSAQTQKRLAARRVVRGLGHQKLLCSKHVKLANAP